MKWNLQGVKGEVKLGVEEFLKYWGILSDKSGVLVNVGQGDCLSVKRTDNGYAVTYSDRVELFRALALLRGSLAEGEADVEICETKKFDTCGVMIDCSRNAVMKVSKLKEVLLKLAMTGINRCLLYTEDTYEMEEYPYFGYLRGAYTKAELKEIDAYAVDLGIEMVPCIQTLGHLRQALRWGYAGTMRDTANVLLIGAEDTYKFIDSMFKTFSECFSSKNIHIGMDEAFGVGTGQYLRLNGQRDKFEILSEHLERVVEIAKKYDLSPVMWSDMFFRLGSKTSGYYEMEPNFPENIKEMIPKEVSLTYWDYYHTDEETYDIMFKNHNKLGSKILFAGGIWKWNGLGANYKLTIETTEPALKMAHKNGIKDVLATMWGDDGAEVAFDTMWLGIQLYAEHNYYTEVSEEHLKKQFKKCLNYDMELFMAFEIDKYPEEWCYNHCRSLSKTVLYQDILHGLFDKNIEGIPLREYYQNQLSRLETMEHTKDLTDLVDYYKQLLSVLSLKSDMGVRISRAYQEKDLQGLSSCVADLSALKDMTAKLKMAYAKVWEGENKVFGFDVIDLRIGGLMSRIETAIRRIDGYIKGDYRILEELETEKLPYNGYEFKENKKLVSMDWYKQVATASSEGVD